MKRLCSLPNGAEGELFKGRLETAGIPCEIRNDATFGLAPGVPFFPELWLLDDAQFAEAEAFLKSWRAAE